VCVCVYVCVCVCVCVCVHREALQLPHLLGAAKSQGVYNTKQKKSP
jgi:hypothetical protein